jgi:hypothetical protein
MLGKNYRPWGILGWTLQRTAIKDWAFVGCLGTEERSLAAWRELVRQKSNTTSWFVEIHDEPSRFTRITKSILDNRRDELKSIRGQDETIKEYDLFADHNQIVQGIQSFISTAGPNILLDVSSMPKRFFFAYTKLLLRAPSVKNLLVTYTVPERYYPGALAEDPKSLAPLPLFGSEEFPEPPVDVVFVGIGFMPFGLVNLFQPQTREIQVKLLFPFPLNPAVYRRNWQFVRDLDKSLPEAAKNPIRVPPYDVSDVFDHLLAYTKQGDLRAIFAPFGAKPISLAMCLYASLTNSPVSYSQPCVYNPEYSTGVKRLRTGYAEIYAYFIKLAGQDLYSVKQS